MMSPQAAHVAAERVIENETQKSQWWTEKRDGGGGSGGGEHMQAMLHVRARLLVRSGCEWDG